MKKVLSIAIVLTMLLSLVSMLGITISADTLEKTYDAAAYGDTLYTANFNSTDGCYKPTQLSLNSRELAPTITISADGSTAKIVDEGATGGQYWGGTIEGLNVTASTRYTVEYLWKNSGANNSGVFFLTGNSKVTQGACYTVYGKISGTANVNRAGTSQYKGLSNITLGPKLDTDGYASVKAEVDGYLVNIFILVDGYEKNDGYKLLWSFTLPEADRANASIACGMFGWQNDANKTETEVKNFTVKKGALVTDPENTGKPFYKTGLYDRYESANVGDLVYKVNFAGDDYYKPYKTTAANANYTVEVKDNGATLVHTSGSTNGAYGYGGGIDGLVVKEDRDYTIYYKYKTGGGNAGAFAVTPTADSAVSAYNFYGQTSATGFNFTPAKGGTTGPYVAQNQLVKDKWHNVPGDVDADGFVDLAVEVDGMLISFYIKKDGKYVEVVSYEVELDTTGSGLIAAGVYTWTNNKSTTVKNFEVYKGALISGKNYNYKTEGLYPKYEAAKNGDLVYSVNFKGDEYFAPEVISVSGNRVPAITPSEDGKSVVVADSSAENLSNVSLYWGGSIKGLVINEDTQYTLEYKIKQEGQYSGVSYLTGRPNDPVYGGFHNFYGRWYDNTAADDLVSIARSGVRITTSSGGAYMTAESAAYTSVTDLLVDADGFVNVKVEIDGLKVTVYYMGTNNELVVLHSYTLSPSDAKQANIFVGVTNWTTANVTTVVDYNIYKGLTVTNDYSEPAAPSAPTGDNTAIIVFAAIVAVSLAGVVVTKKVTR